MDPGDRGRSRCRCRVRDANGNVLSDGANGDNIVCKIDGIGAMDLKSEFVKKV